MTSAAERACELVGCMLAGGPHNAAEILAATEGANISERTIQRAAIALGVTKTKAGFNGGWVWSLPADDGGSTDAPTEQEQPTPIGGLAPAEQQATRSEAVEVGGLRNIAQSPSRAEVIAARLRKLEAGRGKVAPIHAGDPRVMRWAQSGISDSDLREVYERAVFDMERDNKQGPVTAGILDPYF